MAEKKKKKQDEGLKKLREELSELKKQREFCQTKIVELKIKEKTEFVKIEERYDIKSELEDRLKETDGKAAERLMKLYNANMKEYEKSRSSFANIVKRRKIYEKQLEIIEDNIALLKEILPINSKSAANEVTKEKDCVACKPCELDERIINADTFR